MTEHVVGGCSFSQLSNIAAAMSIICASAFTAFSILHRFDLVQALSSLLAAALFLMFYSGRQIIVTLLTVSLIEHPSHVQQQLTKIQVFAGQFLMTVPFYVMGSVCFIAGGTDRPLLQILGVFVQVCCLTNFCGHCVHKHLAFYIENRQHARSGRSVYPVDDDRHLVGVGHGHLAPFNTLRVQRLVILGPDGVALSGSARVQELANRIFGSLSSKSSQDSVENDGERPSSSSASQGATASVDGPD